MNLPVNVMDVLLANLDEAYDRKGWHGATLRGAIRGLGAADVYWRPAPRRHNIYELTVHAAYWKYAVRQRLSGGKRGAFPMKGSDWIPSPPRPDEDVWRDAVALLESEHRQLRAVIAALDARALEERKKVRMIYGVAAHDLYHTGQIQLVKRLHRE